MPVRRSLAVLVAGVGTAAYADPVPLVAQRHIRPAVQLVAVRAVAAPTEVARGVPNTSPLPFDPFFDPNSFAPPRGMPAPVAPDNHGLPPGFPLPPGYPAPTASDPRMTPPGQPRSVWASLSNWTQDRTKAIKSTLGVPPQSPQADPRVGQPFAQQPMLPIGQPFPTQPYAQQPMPGQPFQGVTPAGRAAYAGNPAYRWYGWGTTTPGANPYAPTGESPAGSSQWYAMSRATPGAFPVPVTHPFRAPPGADAPAYAARPASPPKPVADVPPPSFAFEPPAPSGPTPIAETLPFRYVPPDQLPATTTIVPSVPPAGAEWRGPTSPISSNGKTAPAIEETTWQPVSYTPAPAATVASTMVGQVVPASATIAWQEPTLQDRVRAVCGSAVQAVEVKKLGQDSVIVRFDAPSDAVAERVAKAVSQLAELKPYIVTFDVVVVK